MTSGGDLDGRPAPSLFSSVLNFHGDLVLTPSSVNAFLNRFAFESFQKKFSSHKVWL